MTESICVENKTGELERFYFDNNQLVKYICPFGLENYNVNLLNDIQTMEKAERNDNGKIVLLNLKSDSKWFAFAEFVPSSSIG